jgi:hypothetical protein
MDIFWEGLNILISTFCVCADLSTAFHYLIFTFLFSSLKLLILKVLPETLLRIPFSVIGRCSLVPTSHWLQGNAQELTYHWRLPIWFYRITGG